MRRAALVTGASSGIGRAVCESLVREGWQVYAGARSFAVRPDAAPAGCAALYLDLTQPQTVQDAVDHVLAKEGGLDALIQCGAILTLGAAEEVSLCEYRAVLETNFLGTVTAVQAVLPTMRAQQSGRIVLLSSINGRLGIPFQGAYVASKHAVEGWAECLALETRPFGLHVTLIEPGDHRGGADKYRAHAQAAGEPTSPYREAFARGTARIHADEQNGRDPQQVGRAVARVLRAKRPPLRVVAADLGQRVAALLHQWLPGRLFAFILYQYYLGNG